MGSIVARVDYIVPVRTASMAAYTSEEAKTANSSAPEFDRARAVETREDCLDIFKT